MKEVQRAMREAKRNVQGGQRREMDDRRGAPRNDPGGRRREIQDRQDARRREIQDRQDAKRRDFEDRANAKRREMDERRGLRRDDRYRQDFDEHTDAMLHICPSCHSENPEHASFCLSCGSGFDDNLAPQSEPQQEEQPRLEMTNCLSCKASLIGVTGNICPYCRSGIR